MIYGIFAISIILLIVGSLFWNRALSTLVNSSNDNIYEIAALVHIAAIFIPEGIIAIGGSIIGNSQMAVGIMIGCNIVYLLVFGGIQNMTSVNRITDSYINSLAYAIVTTVILLFVCANYLLQKQAQVNHISEYDGILLIVVAIITIIMIVHDIKVDVCKTNSNSKINTDSKPNKKDKIRKKSVNINKSYLVNIIGYILFGMILESAGSVIIVMNIPELLEKNIISINIIAILLLPVLIMVCRYIVLAKLDKEVISAVHDSHIYMDIIAMLLIVGVSACINKIFINVYNIYDIVFMIIMYLMVWIINKFAAKWIRLGGCAMVTAYIAYMIYVCVR